MEILTELPIDGETLIHLGFVLVGASYAVRNPLALRLLAIAAYAVFAVAAVAIQSPALETLLGWYAVFVLLAGSRAFWLVHERRLAGLTPEERRVYQRAFPALDVPLARRLIRAGEWLDLPAGRVLTVEGHKAMHMLLVVEGQVRVSVRGRPVALVGLGQFVGEIGLITDGPATATALAGADDDDDRPLRALAWRQDELLRRMRRDPCMRQAVLAAIGPDLARKLAENNVTITRPKPPAADPPAEHERTPARSATPMPAVP